MQSTSAPAQTVGATRTYRVMDWGGWAVLGLLAAVFVGTGITIRAALHAGHPLLGDVAVIIAGLVALLWAGLYYSLRVSVHAVISEDGLAIVHGPWRHMIAWRDVVRMSEWTTLTEGIRYQWMAVWSVNGTRLQVRHDLVADYPTFRRDLLQHLDAPHEMPAVIVDLTQPLAMTSDLSRAITTWGSLMLISLVSGALMVSLLPSLTVLAIIILALGGLAFLIAVGLYLFRQTITVSGAGVQSQRVIFRRAISWAAMYALERERSGGLRGALGILGRGLVMILFRVDRRSVVVPGADRSFSVITVRGNSGERILIHEERYHHPEWLRARLRAEVAALQAVAAPISPQVQPLPKTGPLAPGTVLPPDPLEASTLWLRESSEHDPFR